jgi:hypothetical protein
MAAGIDVGSLADRAVNGAMLSCGAECMTIAVHVLGGLCHKGILSPLNSAVSVDGLQVLQQCPPVVQFQDSIPLEGASSSSSLDAEDTTDGTEEPADSRPYVFMRVK